MMEHEKPFIDAVKAVSTESKEYNRKQIEVLEDIMLQQEQLDIPVLHQFCGDIYARQIIIPKGTLMTGRVHKFDHFDVMVSGDMTVSTDDGDVKRLTGYNLVKGFAGKKRAGYAHEETVWITFHSSPEQEPDVMMNYLTTANFEEYEHFYNALQKALESKSQQG